MLQQSTIFRKCIYKTITRKWEYFSRCEFKYQHKWHGGVTLGWYCMYFIRIYKQFVLLFFYLSCVTFWALNFVRNGQSSRNLNMFLGTQNYFTFSEIAVISCIVYLHGKSFKQSSAWKSELDLLFFDDILSNFTRMIFFFLNLPRNLCINRTNNHRKIDCL